MNNEIIVIEQLPIIKQQLQTIKADVTERVNAAMSLVCTDENIQEVKKIRTALNKEFLDWESRRKDVKKAIMKPYDDFEAEYKNCITEVFKKGDTDLKGKIDSLETEHKARKEKQVLDYFNECICAAEIGTGTQLFEFVTFEKANINVTLSASLKSLKEQAKAFIDRVCDDVRLIDTQEHKDEILYEYKQTLNVSAAITTVVNRYKALAEAKAREEERKAQAEAMKQAAEKVEKVAETLTPPTVEEAEPILTLKFTVKGTRTQLKALKEYLISGGYDFE